jgi:hypothetical protein
MMFVLLVVDLQAFQQQSDLNNFVNNKIKIFLFVLLKKVLKLELIFYQEMFLNLELLMN